MRTGSHNFVVDDNEGGGPAACHRVIRSFHEQAGVCARLGSPFNARLLKAAAADLEAGGLLEELLGDWAGDPSGAADALPVRFAAALHALVLADKAPDLKSCYPPCDCPDADRLWSAAAASVLAHQPFVEAFLRAVPQTNEVGRSAVLMGGFLAVSQATQMPLRLIEIGASAGLNLIWDRYRYQFGGGHVWGDPSSPVVIAADWEGPLPALEATLTIIDRAACDSYPIDLDNADQSLRLRAYVWADQPHRLVLLDSAIGLARQLRLRVERASAAEWLEGQLALPAEGVATVLFHSFVWQYLPSTERRRIESLMESIGASRSRAAPLAWLRLETIAKGAAPRLQLTLWPHNERRLLAMAHLHGAKVRWLGHRR